MKSEEEKCDTIVVELTRSSFQERRLRDGTTDDLPQRNHVRTKEEAVGAKGCRMGQYWAQTKLVEICEVWVFGGELDRPEATSCPLGPGHAFWEQKFSHEKYRARGRKLVKSCIQHSCPGYSKCINGVSYYIAKASDCDYMIVCFDVRSEKFSFVKAMKRVLEYHVTLINVNGKLASVRGHVSRRKYKF
ncbi:hypothetical protein F2Q69_00031829 [Brassica cretica]|uniref:F-box associated beta-propeller type 3 domain-containing protein n=1 Tax=Brassica cretica TaxID=69181 RepID=A0A8S9RRU0_BRACR|nr:hypothetical protein F2Q69_00031829 [Brassica cretica]